MNVQTIPVAIAILTFCMTSASQVSAAPKPSAPKPATKAIKTVQIDMTEANLKILKDNQKKLQFTFKYSGQQGKPFYKVTLNATDIVSDDQNPFTYDEHITQSECAAIIEVLAASPLTSSPWISKANDTVRMIKIAQPDGYLLEVTGYDTDRLMVGHLGFDANTYRQLAAIRAVLSGKAASAMDTLLTRISFLKP